MNDPVDHQLRAYNNGDLEAFLEAYSDDATVENGEGEEMMSGIEEMRAFYANLFESSPNLHCNVVNRISVGQWVIDEEEVRGAQMEGFPEEIHATVAYQVSGGEITFVRMFI